MAIAHGLTQCDDIGHQTVGLVTPEMLTGATESWLNLVGDKKSAGISNDLRRFFQIAAWRRNDAPTGNDGVNDKRGWFDPALLEFVDRELHIVGEILAGIVTAKFAAIRVRDRNRRDVFRYFAGSDIGR